MVKLINETDGCNVYQSERLEENIKGNKITSAIFPLKL